MGAAVARPAYNPYKLPREKPIYDDIRLAGLLLGIGATPPDLEVFRGTVKAYAFAGTGATVEEGFFALHMPHTYLAGSVPTFHVHWGHKVAVPTGNVKWLIDVTVARDTAGTFAAPTTFSTTQDAGTQYQHLTTDDDDMALTALLAELEPDSILQCRIYRDPAQDTFEDDAFMIEVDLHFQKGQEGTVERSRPYTSAGF